MEIDYTQARRVTLVLGNNVRLCGLVWEESQLSLLRLAALGFAVGIWAAVLHVYSLVRGLLGLLGRAASQSRFRTRCAPSSRDTARASACWCSRTSCLSSCCGGTPRRSISRGCGWSWACSWRSGSCLMESRVCGNSEL